MKQHHLRLLLLSLAVGGSSSAFAQSDLSYIFTARPKYTFSAALKIRTGGASVKFGNLGTIPYQAIGYQTDANGNLLKDAKGAYIPSGNYGFQDGQVATDAARSNQTSSTVSTPDATGKITTTTIDTATPSADGKRYSTTHTVTVDNTTDPTQNSTVTTTTGDFLAYQSGATRNWAYQNQSQVVGGNIDMHAYSSQSDGQSVNADAGSSGGFDLQLSRELGQIGKKAQWGFAFSFGVNEINAKTSGTVTATLLTQTAHFSLLGQTAPTAPYTGPSFTDFQPTDPSGTAVGTVIQATETSVPIADTPTIDSTSQAGKANVDGTWKVKGAYYMMRLGPSFRYQITKRVSLFGNAGVAGGYIGSVYSLTETLQYPTGFSSLLISNSAGGSAPQSPPSVSGEVRNRAFKVGYYGELNAEFWMTYRTGLFVGVVYEHLGNYNQILGGRTADINIGGGTAFRIGIINRF